MSRKYKKYQRAGLPIMELVDNRMQYINFFSVKNKKGKEELEPFFYDSLTDALSDIINDGFYYSFNTLVNVVDETGNKVTKVGHAHEHDFESVVRHVFYNPASFSIDDEDRDLYSKQEYHFLMKLKSYLLAIKREEIGYDDTIEDINDYSMSELAYEYRNYGIKTFVKDQTASLIIDKKKKYFISLKNDFTNVNKKDRYLICDNDGKFLGLVEVVKKKCMRIGEITEKEVDYKLEGFRSLKSFKKSLEDYYKETFESFDAYQEVVINTVKVIKKFK